MTRKSARRINAGIAIYYGIGCIVVAIGGVMALGISAFKFFIGQETFSLGTFLAITALTAVMGAMGYIILRRGYEEIEK